METCYPHWSVVPESSFYQIGDHDYMYRVSDPVLPRKCTLRFEDDNVAFAVFYGRNEKYLGFVLHAKKDDFSAVVQPQWVMLADATSKTHTKPAPVVDFAPMRMIKCLSDGALGASYWLSTRRKDTCL
jgi:hypothetical protein